MNNNIVLSSGERDVLLNTLSVDTSTPRDAGRKLIAQLATKARDLQMMPEDFLTAMADGTDDVMTAAYYRMQAVQLRYLGSVGTLSLQAAALYCLYGQAKSLISSILTKAASLTGVLLAPVATVASWLLSMFSPTKAKDGDSGAADVLRSLIFAEIPPVITAAVNGVLSTNRIAAVTPEAAAPSGVAMSEGTPEEQTALNNLANSIVDSVLKGTLSSDVSRDERDRMANRASSLLANGSSVAQVKQSLARAVSSRTSRDASKGRVAANGSDSLGTVAG
jgi:hypothetical protein